MEIERLRKCYRALEVINGHYTTLAEEVLANEENFYLGGFGKGDSILEKYQHQFYRADHARCALLRASKQIRQNIQMRNKDVHLKEGQFLCFACRNIVSRNDGECSECGWTWEV